VRAVGRSAGGSATRCWWLLFVDVDGRREQLAARPLTQPASSRLSPDDPERAAVAEQQSGYLDPVSGLFVLSAWFLAERGYCCERGCRHCPYVEDGVGPT
jgi:hypothetical protein